MKKIYLLMAMMFLAVVSYSQLLTFEFSALAGSEVTANSNTNATGVLSSVISRGTGVAAAANGGRFNSTGWTMTSSIDPDDYVEFTITPDAGYTLNITDIVVLHQRSGTGPMNFVMRTSLDAYAADATNIFAGTDVTTTQNATFTFTSAINTTSAVTIRLYAYSAEAAGGSWGPGDGTGNDIVVNGTASSAGPSISVTPTSLSGFISTASVASAEQFYTVSGSNLTGDIVITPPAGFQISATSGSGYSSSAINLTPSSGTVPATPIYVVLNSATLGTNTGDITNVSAGATTRNVLLTGKVLAAVPTTQGAITFGTIDNSSIVVNFSSGDGAKRIVLAKLATAVNSDPVDGTTYNANAAFGSGTQIGTGNYVVYAGTGNTVTVTGLASGATYHFAVYEFNDGGTAGAENYLVTAPGIGDATTTVSVTTYTWSGSNGDWTVAGNWTPTRTAPATTDVLQFNDGNAWTITNVPAQTIGQLAVTNNTTINLQNAATATLAISGLAGTDLSVGAGSNLNFDGTFALSLALATGATGVVDGAMTFTNAAHRLTSADASGITFTNGSSFTAGTGFAGNSFGTTSLNSVVFSAGATYNQAVGSNPFGATQPNSVVVFQTSSLYKVIGNNFTPAFSGRTYANVEFAGTGVSTMTGGNPVSIDNLTVTSGVANVNMTGTASAIKGNIVVAAGATLNFAAASAATMNLSGNAPQTITNAGTLTFGANQTIAVNNASGITPGSDIDMSGAAALAIVNGKITLGNYNLTATNITGGDVTNYIVTNGTGALTLNAIDVAPKTFPIGHSKYNPIIIENGSTHNWTAKVTDGLTADGGYNTTKAVLLTWNITPSVNPPAGGADITFQFDEATQVGPSFSTGTTVQAWRRVSGNWITAGVPAAVNTTVPNAATVKVTGLTGFSDYALANIDGPLPVKFSNVKAYQQGSGIKVEWSNLTESNVADYKVERSIAGQSFAALTTVLAAKNDGGRADYSFIDALPVNGVNLYRIQATEADGQKLYSVIVRVDTRGGITTITVYPNPVTAGQLSLQATELPKGLYTVQVYNAAGQQVHSQQLNHNGGSVTEMIQLPASLRSGMYNLHLSNGDMKLGKTFIVR